jgi:hypothetical protein
MLCFLYRCGFYDAFICIKLVLIYPAQNPTSTSPRWAGVTEITYQLTKFWLTEEVLL